MVLFGRELGLELGKNLLPFKTFGNLKFDGYFNLPKEPGWVNQETLGQRKVLRKEGIFGLPGLGLKLL